MVFPSRDKYETFLSSQSMLPKGFTVKTSSLSFVPAEQPDAESHRMNCALLYKDVADSEFAAVATRNQFPGAPITLLREKMLQGSLRGIVVNNCISNVAVPHGIDDARKIAAAAASAVGAGQEEMLSFSTGIIGWKLPVQQMLPLIIGMRDQDPADALSFSHAIMTTDRYPKLARHDFPSGGSMSILAKGAGMIEPDMATMLVFIITDVRMPRLLMQSLLSEVVNDSFNCISVDSDTSTSDMVLLMNSGMRSEIPEEEFFQGLYSLSQSMAEQVVRNGEGTEHVIEVVVEGLPSHQQARALAKTVVNSPLVKTAIHGNDPNVGRIIAAIGKYLADHRNISSDSLQIHLIDECIFKKGVILLTKRKEEKLQQKLAARAFKSLDYPNSTATVNLHINFHQGSYRARVWGSDLSEQYVKINAAYRS